MEGYIESHLAVGIDIGAFINIMPINTQGTVKIYRLPTFSTQKSLLPSLCHRQTAQSLIGKCRSGGRAAIPPCSNIPLPCVRKADNWRQREKEKDMRGRKNLTGVCPGPSAFARLPSDIFKWPQNTIRKRLIMHTAQCPKICRKQLRGRTWNRIVVHRGVAPESVTHASPSLCVVLMMSA